MAELVGLKPLGSGQAIWITPRPAEASFLEKHLPWLALIAALAGIVLVLHLVWSGAASSGGVAPALSLGPDEASSPVSDRQRRPGRPVSADSSPTSQAGHATNPAAGPATGAPVATAVKDLPKAAGPSKRDGDSSPSETVAAHDPGDRATPVSPSLPDVKATADPPPPGSESLPSEEPSSAAEPKGPAHSPSASHWPAAGQTPSPPPAAAAQLVVTGAAEADETEVPGSGPRRFRTLASACAVAHAGETIEICFNGRREERPIQVSSPNVTIRAGEGFHPRIVFQPDASDPAKYARSMIGLSGGQLVLQGLSLELEVPRLLAAENWSLVQLSPGQSLKLNRCWLTIRNASNQQTAYHPDVAFVRVSAPPGMDPAIGDEAPPEPASLTLTDCIARGEATFLHSEGPQPIELVWNNGLLATSERLFSAEGGEQASRAGLGVHLQLDHLTAELRSGLCRLARSEYAPHQLPCRIGCAHSMLFGSARSPLIEQVTFASGEDSLAAISWDGRQNSYPGFLIFWRTQQLDDSPSKEMTFDAWKTHWRPEHESQPGAGPVGWSPSADVPGLSISADPRTTRPPPARPPTARSPA